MSNKTRFLTLLFLLLAVAALAAAPAALAQSTTITDDQVNEVAHDLYCPVCESTPLDVCPTQACRDWREVIRTQLAEGRSKQQIMDYFAEQYGDRVLAEPLAVGLTSSSGFCRQPPSSEADSSLRATSIACADQRTTATRKPPSSPPPSGEDPYLARVEKELQQKS